MNTMRILLLLSLVLAAVPGCSGSRIGNLLRGGQPAYVKLEDLDREDTDKSAGENGLLADSSLNSRQDQDSLETETNEADRRRHPFDLDRLIGKSEQESGITADPFVGLDEKRALVDAKASTQSLAKGAVEKFSSEAEVAEQKVAAVDQSFRDFVENQSRVVEDTSERATSEFENVVKTSSAARDVTSLQPDRKATTFDALFGPAPQKSTSPAKSTSGAGDEFAALFPRTEQSQLNPKVVTDSTPAAFSQDSPRTTPDAFTEASEKHGFRKLNESAAFQWRTAPGRLPVEHVTSGPDVAPAAARPWWDAQPAQSAPEFDEALRSYGGSHFENSVAMANTASLNTPASDTGILIPEPAKAGSAIGLSIPPMSTASPLTSPADELQPAPAFNDDSLAWEVADDLMLEDDSAGDELADSGQGAESSGFFSSRTRSVLLILGLVVAGFLIFSPDRKNRRNP